MRACATMCRLVGNRSTTWRKRCGAIPLNNQCAASEIFQLCEHWFFFLIWLYGRIFGYARAASKATKAELEVHVTAVYVLRSDSLSYLWEGDEKWPWVYFCIISRWGGCDKTTVAPRWNRGAVSPSFPCQPRKLGAATGRPEVNWGLWGKKLSYTKARTY